MSLFNQPHARSGPLADRLRPAKFDDYVGQERIVGPNSALRAALREGKLPSMIFWGPPGCGKTTLARILAAEAGLDYVQFSAVTSGIKEIREFIDRAKSTREQTGRGTILFVDEIHRFNKAQQDAFLPHVEDGTIVLVGATTENPSFEVNAALLSRSRVFRLEKLTEEDIWAILRRALSDGARGLGGRSIDAPPRVLETISRYADGDARAALNLLDLCATTTPPSPDGTRHLTEEGVKAAAQRKTLMYDKSGEEHFNIISALHKSLRNSDAQAAVYWLARMLEAGEDPLYVARRLVRFASEDVGLADPGALRIALSAKEAVDFIGMPEGALALAQATVYLATAPKSNALYKAYAAAAADLQATENAPVPLHLRNATTQLMKEEGYGQGYVYAHDVPGSFAPGMVCLPEPLKDRRYYEPTKNGYEAQVAERLARWDALRSGTAESPPAKPAKPRRKK